MCICMGNVSPQTFRFQKTKIFKPQEPLDSKESHQQNTNLDANSVVGLNFVLRNIKLTTSLLSQKSFEYSLWNPNLYYFPSRLTHRLYWPRAKQNWKQRQPLSQSDLLAPIERNGRSGAKKYSATYRYVPCFHD